MQQLTRFDNPGEAVQPSAVCIGNFDGVHVGHQALIQRVVALAGELNVTPSALTFDPHPAVVLAPDRAPKLLTTLSDRARLMQERGIQQVLVLRFDEKLASMTPVEFARDILSEFVQARAVVVGENFRFGHKQSGNVQLLSELGASFGFQVRAVESVTLRGKTASSSEVRSLVQSGNVSLANRMLRRPYSITGMVVSGFGVGSRQTVPTLNLESTAEIHPGRGVYITRTRDVRSARSWNSITNVGCRPTFGGTKETVETFLLSEFDGVSPLEIELSFLRRVREERKFETPEALKAQILADVHRAHAYFRRLTTIGATQSLC